MDAGPILDEIVAGNCVLRLISSRLALMGKDRVREFTEFLDPNDNDARSYTDSVKLMLNRGERRLPVNLDEIRNHNRQLAEGYVMHSWRNTERFC